MIDVGDTIAPKSDQLNADDLLSGPRTFTIADVRKVGTDEQPLAITLAEFPKGRPYKPSKGMRRVMVEAWGRDGAKWVGHRLTLFRDPGVMWAGQPVGGVRISHMSHLRNGRPLRMALTVSSKQRDQYVVEPLPDSAPAVVPMSAATGELLIATFRRKGIAEDTWLAGVNHITGGSATALEVLTEDQAQQVLATLAAHPDVEQQPTSDAGDEHDPTTDPDWQGGAA